MKKNDSAFLRFQQITIPLNLVFASYLVFVITLKSNAQFINGNGVTDLEGNTYSTVIINGKEWMKENLKVSKFSNGEAIPNVTDANAWFALTSPAWAVYNNDLTYEQYYGKLYNWYVVNDSRKVCPNGWHIPTDNEWKSLELFLGMTQDQVDNTSWRGTIEGVKLKSDYGWNSNGNGTNESGYEGLPGGLRHPNGNFSDLGNLGIWWTSTGKGSLPYQNAYERRLKSIYDKVYRIGSSVKTGANLRCVSDNAVSIEQIQIDETILIYPNPINEILNIELTNLLDNNTVIVFDITGKEIFKSMFNAPKSIINTSNWNSGVYVLNFGGKSYKIIKE